MIWRRGRAALAVAALTWWVVGCGGSAATDAEPVERHADGASIAFGAEAIPATELLDGGGTGAPGAGAGTTGAAAAKAFSTQADQFFYAESFDRVAVYRFFIKQRGGHFYTASVEERDAVIAQLPDTYQYEGAAFHAYATASGQTKPVYRFYNTQTGYHLYTASEDERGQIVASLPHYTFEGVAYHVGATSHTTLRSLHRFFNTRLGYHFYTASEEEKTHITANLRDFSYEGVAYPVFGSSDVPWQGVGGSATAASGAGGMPFLQFSPGLSISERLGLSQGRELFVAQWTPAPGARAVLDGLGPLFNADACTACHVENGRAPSLVAGGTIGRGMLFRIGNREGGVSATYGGQLQDRSTAGSPEGTVTWSDPLDSGDIAFALSVLGTPLEAGMHLGPRLSPHLMGMGLLDLVPQTQLLEFADAGDTDGNGISGRPHWLPDGSLGRFGWKAINQSLRHQIAGALHQDMGLTTPLHLAENCTANQTLCNSEADGGTPEVAEESLDNMTRFMTGLSVPARRHDDLARFQRGGKVFTEIGCAQCHRPVLRTGTSTAFPSLSNQLIYPYTDLLLHDMGAELDDGVKELGAEPSEWRTPPLWGIGLVAASANARFLHDGRARTVNEAVRWHGGEALPVRQRYEALDQVRREDLLHFVHGL